MKALVTGGCGYFGGLLARRLRAAGHDVRVFDLNADLEDPAGIELVRGDIRDAAAVSAACRGMDWVFHAVAQVPLARDAALFWSVNRDGTKILLDAAAAAGARKVVYISSSAVFGVPKSNPVDERAVPEPAEDYGRAKLAGEGLCREASGRGLDATIIRPRTILGHGRLGIFSVLFDWVSRGCNVPVLGDGSNVYQFVHADDLAEACLLAAARPGPSLYHCGAAEYGTMRQALEALCAHAKTGSRVRALPKGPAVAAMKLTSALRLSPLGPYHALMYGESLYFSLDKIRGELGWAPKWSNEAMMKQSYDWYLANRDRLPSGASAHRSGLKPGILSLVGRML